MKRPPNNSVALDRAGITVFRDITFLAAGPASERNRSRALSPIVRSPQEPDVDTHRIDDRAIREGEPAFFPGDGRSSSLPPDPDGADITSKELPLAGQFTAMLVLWFTWLAALVFVVWRGWKLEGEMRYYDCPFIVYPIVFTYIPLALVALGALFLWRVRNVEPMARATRAFRLAVGVMTILTAGVLLTVGVWAFSLPWEVIRE